MTISPIETDYLVIGAGAIGMAFVDTLLTDTDAQIVMVDRHHRPGGHWNDVYPFVRLHQPAAYYGVNSRELAQGTKDSVGLNEGMYNLAGGAEVLAYFDQVMQQRFLPSGRVRFLPKSQVIGSYEVESLLTGRRQPVQVRKKVVDATYSGTQVPSTTPPRYSVAPDVRCVPLNDLVKLTQPQAGYVVVGSGKTGIDACLWLLEQGVDPDDIRWIMPRDAWLLDRANLQPGDEFFMNTCGIFVRQLEAVAAAEDVPDLLHRLEAAGEWVRIDTRVQPTVYHGATVSQAELAELRRIQGIVRLGHVISIEPSQINLDQAGRVAAHPRHREARPCDLHRAQPDQSRPRQHSVARQHAGGGLQRRRHPEPARRARLGRRPHHPAVVAILRHHLQCSLHRPCRGRVRGRGGEERAVLADRASHTCHRLAAHARREHEEPTVLVQAPGLGAVARHIAPEFPVPRDGSRQTRRHRQDRVDAAVSAGDQAGDDTLAPTDGHLGLSKGART